MRVGRKGVCFVGPPYNPHTILTYQSELRWSPIQSLPDQSEGIFSNTRGGRFFHHEWEVLSFLSRLHRCRLYIRSCRSLTNHFEQPKMVVDGLVEKLPTSNQERVAHIWKEASTLLSLLPPLPNILQICVGCTDLFANLCLGAVN